MKKVLVDWPLVQAVIDDLTELSHYHFEAAQSFRESCNEIGYNNRMAYYEEVVSSIVGLRRALSES